MVVAAAIGASAAASVVGGAISASGAKSAAGQQAAAANEAAQVQQAMFETARGDLAPYRGFGQPAMNRLGAIFGGVATPGRPASTTTTTTPGVPAAVATGAGQLANAGFTPANGNLPPGYSIQQVGGGDDGPSRKVLTGPGGGIVSELPGSKLDDSAAGMQWNNNLASTILQSQGIGGAPAATTTINDPGTPDTPALSAWGQPIVPGALPGASSGVNPYAAPNNGVFDPVGGDLVGGFAFNPTVADLENTPGYQFMLSQGLKATQSNAAARGLGMSGAAMKEAGRYATGLADSNWQNVFGAELSKYTTNRDTFSQNWQRQQQQFGSNLDASIALNNQYYNSNVAPLFQQASLGENAAATSGNQAISSGNTIGNSLTGIGNANAAGTVGMANAIAGGITGAGNAGTNYLFMNKLLSK